MPKLPDFPILDFSGGLVLNKSDYDMQRNELKDTHNVELDIVGKLKRRRGYQQFGTTISGGTFSGRIVNAYSCLIESAGIDSIPLFLINDDRSGINVYRLVATSFLTTALNDGDTTITLQDNTNYGSSGIVEVGGDLITYTSKTGGTILNITESTILLNGSYPVGTPVNEWSAAVTVSTVLGDVAGVYYTLINNVVFINGTSGSATTADGITITAVTGEPDAIFATNYRDRIYVAGSGGSGTNASRKRVSFSNAGTATTWDSNDFFDVEDIRGEGITGLTMFNDKLYIFKTNSIFSYDEIQLKAVQLEVGAYSHYNVEEIDGILYTFCPAGIFATNGSEAKRISDPVQDYIKDFRPDYQTSSGAGDMGRIVRNTYSFSFQKKYCVYIQDTESPKSRDDVVLVYNTLLKNWEVWSGFDDFQRIVSMKGFSCAQTWQAKEAVFGLDDTGKVYRLFNSQTTSDNATTVGGDIIADNISNSVGTPISTLVETPFYTLGNPSWWKKFGSLRVLMEQGEFQISYRLDKGDYFTDWISLGEFKDKNSVKKLKDNTGYRIAFSITSNTQNSIGILNGLILEDLEAISKKTRTYAR